MFGTVQPRSCALPGPDRDAYRRLTCGTCRALGDHGTPVRALTSYDAVLLAAIVDGLTASEAPCGTCRCPIAPWVHRPIITPDAPAVRTAAAVQLLLADAWLADRFDDGLPAAGWLRPWVPSDAAAAALEALGLDPASLRAVTAAQQAVEHPGARPRAAAEPTAALLEGLFRSLLDLPDVDPALVTASARGALGRIGRALGTAVYLIDALADLPDDVQSGAFNPCLDPDRRVRAERVAEAAEALRTAVAELGQATSTFPWRRNRALLVDTVGERLPERAEAAIRAAVAVPADALPVRASWLARWAGWLWRGAAALWAAGSVPGGKRKRNRDTGWCGWCLPCGDMGETCCCCLDCGECCTGCDCPCDGCG
jgi:hypothetical protein